METILIMARGLEKASKKHNIVRLDIQYNEQADEYDGYVYFDGDLGGGASYKINDAGEVLKLH